MWRPTRQSRDRPRRPPDGLATAMPLPFLIAMMLAFGLDLNETTGPLPRDQLRERLTLVAVGLVGLAALALGIGRLVAWRVRRMGSASSGLRRAYRWNSTALEGLALVYFAWILHGLDWVRVVDWGLGLRETILVDELLILLPYLL